MLRCDVCDLNLNSHQQYDDHVRGQAHRKALNRQNYAQPTSPVQQGGLGQLLGVEDASPLSGVGGGQFFCRECNAPASSAENLAQHLAGSKHAKRLRQLALAGVAVLSPPAGSQASQPAPAHSLPDRGLESLQDLTDALPRLNGHGSAADQDAWRSPGDGGVHAPVDESPIDGQMDLSPQSPAGDDLTYFCAVCKVPATSYENFKQHLAGKPHARKARLVSVPGDGGSSMVHPSPGSIPGPSSSVPYPGSLRRPKARPKSHPPLTLRTTDLLAQPTKQSLRGYQRELYRHCMRGNRVVYLPTGMGKTLVGASVLSHMLRLNPTRQVVFIVDRVLLVVQQSAYLRDQLNAGDGLETGAGNGRRRRVLVAGLCGEKRKLEHDMPSGSEREHDVIVVTAGCYLNLLLTKSLRWEDVSCVVLDEAHHCGKLHPFNELVKQFYHGTAHKPALIGLTASPVGELTVEVTRLKLSQLLKRMDAELASVVEHRESYDKYLKRAELRCVVVDDDGDDMPDIVVEKTRCSDFDSSLSDSIIAPMELTRVLSELLEEYIADLLPHNKRCTAGVQQPVDLEKVKAAYCYRVVQWHKSAAGGEATQMTGAMYLLHVQIVTRGLVDLRAGQDVSELVKLSMETDAPYSFEAIWKEHAFTPSDSWNAMIELLVDLSAMGKRSNGLNQDGGPSLDGLPDVIALPGLIPLPGAPAEESVPLSNAVQETTPLSSATEESLAAEHVCLSPRHDRIVVELLKLPWGERGARRPVALVLVELRSDAYDLCDLLNADRRLLHKNVKCLVIVGQGQAGTAPGMTVNQQGQAMHALRDGYASVAVCTSVAEEGLDLPACSLVIQTRKPPNVTSLVQSWGRARARSASFLVLCSSEVEADQVRELKTKEKNMEDVAKEEMRRQALGLPRPSVLRLGSLRLSPF